MMAINQLLAGPNKESFGARRRTSKGAVLLVGNFLSAKTRVHCACEDLATRLEDEGWQVLTTSHQRQPIFRLLDMVGTVWCRQKQYSIAQVDVYSGRGFMLAEAACYALRVVGKPFVLMLHGGNLPSFSHSFPGRIRRLLQSASAVVAPSHYLLGEMQRYRADIQLIPNGLSLDAYPFSLRKQPAPRLLWIRSFNRIYNPLLGPKVVALLAPEFPDIQLIMVGADRGDGSFKATQQLALKLGVAERISMPGGVSHEEIPRWLASGDIFLNTANVDNTPVSLLEAMASGLCVISTNVGGIPYLLTHEQDALLVPPDDPETTAAAVRRAIAESGLTERLCRNAREKSLQFDWSVVLPNWEQLLQTAANSATKRFNHNAPTRCVD